MKVFCFTLDLKNDPELIEAYIAHHKHVWPEIIESIKSSGIRSMEIFHFNTRLFMRIEAKNDFSLEKKSAEDKHNPKVQEWEELMWKYQLRIEGSQPGEKWVLMDKIFDLK